MPVFICVRHLHQDFLYVHVSGFHCTIHLRVIGKKIYVLDLEPLVELLDHFPISVRIIICNEFSWPTIVANNVVF